MVQQDAMPKKQVNAGQIKRGIRNPKRNHNDNAKRSTTHNHQINRMRDTLVGTSARNMEAIVHRDLSQCTNSKTDEISLQPPWCPPRHHSQSQFSRAHYRSGESYENDPMESCISQSDFSWAGSIHFASISTAMKLSSGREMLDWYAINATFPESELFHVPDEGQ